MLPTRMVDMSRVMPSHPIMPMTVIIGIRLGTMLSKPRQRLPSRRIINGVMMRSARTYDRVMVEMTAVKVRPKSGLSPVIVNFVSEPRTERK